VKFCRANSHKSIDEYAQKAVSYDDLDLSESELFIDGLMKKTGLRKIDKWTKDYNLEIITFKKSSIDPFFNINTKEDLDLAKNYLRN